MSISCKLLNDLASYGTLTIYSYLRSVFCSAHNRLNKEETAELCRKYLLRGFNYILQLLTKDTINIVFASYVPRALFSGHLAVATLVWLCCYFYMVLMCS